MGRCKQKLRPVTSSLVVAITCLAAFGLSISSTVAQTLQRVADSGVMKIGFREDARPFSFKDMAGEPHGFAIELCREVAADVKTHLGLAELSIEYIPVTTEDRFKAVADGRIDLLCGASTVTLARREIVSFSIPTFQTGIAPLMRADVPAFLRDTLARRQSTRPPRAAVMQAFTDRRFGVRSNTTAEAWLGERIKTLASNATLVTVDSHDEGLRQVADGKLDAYFADRAILLGLVMATGLPSQFLIGERLFTHEPYGLALPKGDEDFRLLVDRSLSQLYRSLEIEPIFTRHFGRPGRAVLAMYLITALPE